MTDVSILICVRVDYVSGNLDSESVGHQVRGSLIPHTSIDTSFPVIRRSSAAAQTASDYSSVDVNSVTIDSRNFANSYGTPSDIMRIIAPSKTMPVYNSPNIKRIIGSSPAYSAYTSAPIVELRTPAAPVYSTLPTPPTSPVVGVARILESATPAYSSQSSLAALRTPATNVGSYGQEQNNVAASRTPQQPTSSTMNNSYGFTGQLKSFLGNLAASGGRISGNSNNNYGQQQPSKIVLDKGLANSGSSTSGKPVTLKDNRRDQY